MRYTDVLFDFHYLREPEEYERRINESSTLVDLDQDFQENYQVRYCNRLSKTISYNRGFIGYFREVLQTI